MNKMKDEYKIPKGYEEICLGAYGKCKEALDEDIFEQFCSKDFGRNCVVNEIGLTLLPRIKQLDEECCGKEIPSRKFGCKY